MKLLLQVSPTLPVATAFSSSMIPPIQQRTTNNNRKKKNRIYNNNNNKNNSQVLLYATPTPNDVDEGEAISRRDLLLQSPIAIGGAIVYVKLVSDAFQKLARGDQVYPDGHETRVEDTFARAMVASIPPSSIDRPLRVLEIGIGNSWRVNTRGLYHSSLDHLSSKGVTKVELTGVDISVPNSKTIEQLSNQMKQYNDKIDVDINVVQQSITSKSLPFDDGYFDCVVGSLVLCSVDDQNIAIQEIQRLVRPKGGTYGYVEHVAVNPDRGENYPILELQQNVFDPLQQRVADNCHLHRFTDDSISTIFGIMDNGSKTARSTSVFSERYLVEDMWPVSCQCRGVIQRMA